MDWISKTASIPKQRITHTDNKAWLAFDASVADLESLLRTEYHEHHDTATGRSMITCDQYHVPAHLVDHIDYITPGIKGVHVHSSTLKKRSWKPGHHGPGGYGGPPGWQPPKHHPAPYMPWNNSELSTCDVAITPACLRALYHFEPLPPNAEVSPNNSMGIFEEGDFYDQFDLNSFFTNFTKYIPNGTHPVLDSIDGGMAPVTNLSQAGGEANLDFELAIPIIYPQTATLYQSDDLYYALGGNGTTGGIFNTFLDSIDGSYCTYSAYGETGNDPHLDPTYPDPNGYQGQLMCGVYKPTNVISISYGEQEQDLPAYYQKRQCNEFLKLGLQGVSIFVASGDTGVAGIPGDGSANGCLRNGTVFSPTQPNSCPWLTNVGATKVYPGRTVFEPESAVVDLPGHPYHSAFSSSGGFSNIFPIPDYQTSAIAGYFADYNPPYPYYYNGQYNSSDGLYNRNGRGIPDVAANGDNIALENLDDPTVEQREVMQLLNRLIMLGDEIGEITSSFIERYETKFGKSKNDPAATTANPPPAASKPTSNQSSTTSSPAASPAQNIQQPVPLRSASPEPKAGTHLEAAVNATSNTVGFPQTASPLPDAHHSEPVMQTTALVRDEAAHSDETNDEESDDDNEASGEESGNGSELVNLKDPKGVYAMLGVSPDASMPEVQKAIRKMLVASHPDRNPDNPDAGSDFAEFMSLCEETVKTEEKRRAYDNITTADELEQLTKRVRTLTMSKFSEE
ncbi:hypothetical protein LTR48_001037 [Friedmanniomyces endolithicus]|nr:hypothetical protein LTR48_001037 [Friedmanniomyces endolithicus]